MHPVESSASASKKPSQTTRVRNWYALAGVTVVGLVPQSLFGAIAQTARVAPSSGADKPLAIRIVWPLAIIIVLAGLLMAVLSTVRRRIREAEQSTPLRGFTLDDLRQLKRDGKLTDAEFDRAKAKLVSNVQQMIKKEAKPQAGVEPFDVEPKP